ncbi:hypothetical protein BFJ66_g15149 [Fusarium oxysporum f. sp. cepae]|uniref:Uncharacterized protein n=1 Tax=Fusarium oxysporum f. sp. cepae TaxID=396571 RepID=A0A3L6N3M0_FUSOX|nr:hypothetical protein BFJ65_g14957 [Fusarium oxysporum f. sp. cepae]RKK31529.1 hypothetical protein BFJ67_g15198 [Fusarium oxysporum f. sp. cepae]RKK32934.1 hypothetical protein BFJ66_g15149 [Fusarium oxysporum f. sp. cepae]
MVLYNGPLQSSEVNCGSLTAYDCNGISGSSLEGCMNMQYFQSTRKDANGQHIQPKYTEDEGEYFIYVCIDKNMQCCHLKKDSATRFGTTQGLQACY